MSLRRKLRKLRHMYKERGKEIEKNDNKKSCREQGVDEVKDNDDENDCHELPCCKKAKRANNLMKMSKKPTRKKRKMDEDITNLYKFKQGMVTNRKKKIEVVDLVNTEQVNENEITFFENSEFNTNCLKESLCVNRTNFSENSENYDWSLVNGRRDVLPEYNDANSRIYELEELKSVLIEHCYFKGKGKLQRETVLNENNYCEVMSGTTLPFRNNFDSDENETEQQKIDSATKHIDPLSLVNLCNNSSVKNSFQKSGIKRHSESKVGCASNVNNPNLVGESANEAVRSPLSDGSSAGIECIWEGSSLMTQPSFNGESHLPTSDRPQTDKVKASFANQIDERNPSDFGEEAVTLDQIDREIAEIEKILQAKCDLETAKCEGTKGDGKTSETLSPKPKKAPRTEMQEPLKDENYILSMPNLGKMVPEDKNWNLEYTDDDVKNLGLDDLLLRASELNAENFTKALGQNSVARGGSKNDSDIVLTFPNSRRNSEDGGTRDDESGKGGKKTKLDFLRKYVTDDKRSEEEGSKKYPESSPKRPGIKVKTVQNINEEFKDSLGAKMKSFDGRDVTSDSLIANKPLFAVDDDPQQKEIFEDVRDQVSNNSMSRLSCRVGKMSKTQDQGKTSTENSDEARPFIMTIIQNKESEGHVPAILRNSKTRAKAVNSENFLPHVEERRVEVGGDKKDQAEAVDVLNVSEPRSSRPFEMVNMDGYVDAVGHVKKNAPLSSHYVIHYQNGPFSRKKDATADGKVLTNDPCIPVKRKNIPFIMNNPKKCLRTASSGKTSSEDKHAPLRRLVKLPSERDVQGEKAFSDDKSVPEKILSKESKILKKVSTETRAINERSPSAEDAENLLVEDVDVDQTQSMSLGAFANILKDILPDKWILSLDKRYGLQIIKTHLDEYLNPSIMISVVVGRTGKVTVNVRGRQLEKSHDLFSNLCDVGNSNEKISINYILAILNKLRFFSVCFGCDDLSLKKYWCEDGFIEYYTEFQQTYRSHVCESLVRLGKKRCYPCYRMHESLKKRRRREQANAAASEKTPESVAKSTGESDVTPGAVPQAKGVKRNLEEFLEESFITMKQKIADEIEKAKEDEESEKVPKTQDEVLSFMGLTRKDSLDVNLRKSKRERKGFKKCESMIGHNVNKEELYFLEKYWSDINVLFSTSLLIGAYSRTSTERLREKCKMFHELLATWKGIVRDNPEWLGGSMNLAENLVEDEDPLNADSSKDKFEKMDVPALRAYIINCVKEVNKIKSRLRAKNAYFRVLYNTFVKPRMKKGKKTTGAAGSETAAKDEGSPEKVDESASAKPSNSANTTSTEVESSDEKDEDTQMSNGGFTGTSDGE